MISIIVCSRSADISSELKKSISSTIGVDFEIIVIDNSLNTYSIFEAYNLGARQAVSPYLCFIHEDVSFSNSSFGWGGALENKLSNKKVGVIGVAGADIVTRIPAPWSSYRFAKRMNLIQGKAIDNGDLIFEKRFLPVGVADSFLPVVLLDGVFLAMRKDIFNEISFNENFTGFHGYDFDISLQSCVAGYENYVMYEKILLTHYSLGNINKYYYENLIKVFKLFESHLPILNGLSLQRGYDISAIEYKQIRRFCLNLMKSGFSYKEVMRTFKYYSRLIKLPIYISVIYHCFFSIVYLCRFKYVKQRRLKV